MTQEQMMTTANIQGINDGYVVIIGFAVIALLLSFFIKRTAQAIEEKPRAAAAQPVADH